ncbi:uncharacterized protein LOC118203128 [Stegodyphus dumicola]|uniref:uncharacterized protein LOC118203128 n=1 Tax=Stegodyphus dumicola TaxID=202533 RepID=UPI0015B22A0C|nr:uncharacterized protein LOC118203128 [Stegodyphus dumicola]
MATTGILIYSTLQTIITSFSNASPYWFIVSSAVPGFSGGLVIVISSAYSYMSDITDERSRNVRFAILEFFTIMATPTGSLVGGQVYVCVCGKRNVYGRASRYDNMRKSFKTCVKERPGNLRMQIWLLLFISLSLLLIQMGSVAIGFSYTQKVFKWKVTRYSYTTATFSLLNAAATLTIV